MSDGVRASDPEAEVKPRLERTSDLEPLRSWLSEV